MGIFDLDHRQAVQPTAGPEKGFWEGLSENFSAAYDKQYEVDSVLAYEDNIRTEWEENRRRAEQRLGKQLPVSFTTRNGSNISGYVFNNITNQALGSDERSLADFFSRAGSANEVEARTALTAVQEIDKQIQQLNDPSILTLAQIVKKYQGERDKINATVAEASTTSGIGGAIGGLAGGIAGSFSTRDPFNVLTIPLGGVGKTAVTRIAAEMGINAGVEYANQALSVQPTQAASGENVENALWPVIYAAAGAGLIQGGFEGFVKLRNKVNAGDFSGPDIELDFNDGMLRQMFERQEESPAARAGLHLLDQNDLINRANPYGDTEAGLQRFTGELEQITAMLSGKTDTAVARVLPGIPVRLEEFALDHSLVKAEQPELYARYESAQAKLEDIDVRIAETEGTIKTLTPADGIARLDPELGARVKDVENKLQNATTAYDIIKYSKELDELLKDLDPEVIKKQFNDASIKPVKDLKSLRKARKNALKEHKEASRLIQEEIKRVQDAALLKEVTENARTLPEFLAATATKSAEEQANKRLAIFYSPDKIQEVATAAKEVAERIPDLAERIVDDYAEVIEGEAPKDFIDVGNGHTLPKDFSIEVRLDDGSTKTLTADQIMKDLQADKELDEAVRICSL